MPDSAPRSSSQKLLLSTLVLLSGVALAPAEALAQRQERRIERAIRTAEENYRLKVDTNLSLAERSVLDVGGFASFVAMHLTDANENSRRLLQPEVSLYARGVIDGAHSFFVRSRFQYRDYSEGDSFDERGDRWTEPFVDRYWYEFDYARAVAAYEGRETDWNFNVRAGRQFVDWGQGLTLSETLYSVRPTVSIGRFSLEGLAGVTPTDDSVVDFDASRDGFNADTERGFFGGLARYRTRTDHEFYGFVLWQDDYNGGDKPRAALDLDGDGVRDSVDFEYDSGYAGLGAQGSFSPQWLYGAEFVYEFGEGQSDPLRGTPAGAQVEEDISAWAGRGVLTYLLKDVRRTRVQAELLLASGDDDRFVTTDTVGGNEPGTDDNAFNAMGYANTGLAFSPALSNIIVTRIGFSTFPFIESESFRQLQFGFDLLIHNKMDEDAPIEEPTSNDRFLGVETDFSVNYRITSDLALIARYGAFFPSDTIESSEDTRHFVYFGITLSF